MIEYQPNGPVAMTEAEAKTRADFILYLESKNVPFEEAVLEGDGLIAQRRAFGYCAQSDNTEEG